MKKALAKKNNDDLRPEYDLSKLKGGVRGKYYKEATANRVSKLQLHNRLKNYARQWGVTVKATRETQNSLIAFGTRNGPPGKEFSSQTFQEVAADLQPSTQAQSVVVKIIKRPGDEWRSGKVLKAFDGHGVVRVYEEKPGAILMERLSPGNSLVNLTLSGRDEEAIEILAGIISEMSLAVTSRESSGSSDESSISLKISSSSQHSSITSAEHLPTLPTLHDWAKGFERYLATGDKQIPTSLVEAGQRVYLDLAGSQRNPRLLHGDLQHYNVLFDSNRGWIAIDPKGVIGEGEYELGAILRNPIERPDLFLSPATIESRLKQLTNSLNLNLKRAHAWTFSQAVLSAIWDFEDGFGVLRTKPSLSLANVVRRMIETVVKSLT